MSRKKSVEIGGTSFQVDETADVPFRRIKESVHVPRQDVAGVPGAQNLMSDEWVWTISDWSGGEGRIAFDPNDADFFGAPLNPPHFRTSSGIDTREPGSFKLLPGMAQEAITGSVYTVHRGVDDLGWIGVDDGTNLDIYKYTPSTNAIALETGNVVAITGGSIFGMTASDNYEYVVVRDSGGADEIWYWNDATAAAQYASVSDGALRGVAVAANRLYALATGGLYEFTLDETAGLPLTGTEVVEAPATAWSLAGSFSLTSTDNGVRWITGNTGTSDSVWEYSDGTGKPIGRLPDGFYSQAIYHMGGITWISGVFTEGVSIGQARDAVYYIDADGEPKFLAFLRYEAAPSPIGGLQAMDGHGSSLYIASGERIWRYDTGTGGITLEAETGQTANSLQGFATFGISHLASYGAGDIYKSDTTYPTAQRFVNAPVWDFGVAHLDKTALRFVVQTEPLPTSTEVDIDYQDNEDGTWTSAGAAKTSGSFHEFDLTGSTVSFKNMQYRVGIRSTTGGANTPVVRSASLVAYVIDYMNAYEMTLLLQDETATDRVVSHQESGDKLADAIFTLADAKAITTFVDHYSSRRPGDTDSENVIIEDPVLERRGKKMLLRLRLKVV